MSTFNRATLAKVLEILGSDHAGEALAAAKLASTMVREAGLTWDEVQAGAEALLLRLWGRPTEGVAGEGDATVIDGWLQWSASARVVIRAAPRIPIHRGDTPLPTSSPAARRFGRVWDRGRHARCGT